MAVDMKHVYLLYYAWIHPHEPNSRRLNLTLEAIFSSLEKAQAAVVPWATEKAKLRVHTPNAWVRVAEGDFYHTAKDGGWLLRTNVTFIHNIADGETVPFAFYIAEHPLDTWEPFT